MEDLFRMGTPEAYRAVLERFTYLCQSLHWDDQEKRWLVDKLAETGEPCVAPLKAFILEDDAVNFAVRALERLVTEQEVQETLLAALKARAPDDYRKAQAKIELIDHLGSRPPSPLLWEAIRPYLDDHSDDVRNKVLEVVEGWKHAGAAGEVAALLQDDTLSARIHRQAARCLCTLEVKLNPAPVLPPAALEDYQVDGDGQVVKRRPTS
jgi:hypothetical protein